MLWVDEQMNSTFERESRVQSAAESNLSPMEPQNSTRLTRQQPNETNFELMNEVMNFLKTHAEVISESYVQEPRAVSHVDEHEEFPGVAV